MSGKMSPSGLKTSRLRRGVSTVTIAAAIVTGLLVPANSSSAVAISMAQSAAVQPARLKSATLAAKPTIPERLMSASLEQPVAPNRLKQVVVGSPVTPARTKLITVLAAVPNSVVNAPGGFYVPAGSRLRITDSTLYVGFYRNLYGNEVENAICLQSGKALRTAQAFVPSRTIPGVADPVVAQKIAYLVNSWGYSENIVLSSATVLAVKYFGDPLIKPDWAFYANALPTVLWHQIYGQANKMIAAANRNYGPHKISLILGPAAFPGQPIAGKSVVQNVRTNAVVPNIPVRVTVSNGQPVGALPTKTGADGAIRFSIRATSFLAPTVSVTATLPDSSRLLVTRPSGQQELVTGYPSPEIIRVAKSVGVKKPVAPSVSFKCTTPCNGVAPVTISACNAVGAYELQYVAYDNGKLAGNIRMTSGVCRPLTIQVADTHRITVAARYKVNGQWTAFIKQPTNLLIVCPPQANVSVAFTCACVPVAVLTVTIATNRTSHTQLIAVTGSDGVRRIIGTLNPGQGTGTVHVRIPRSTLELVETGTYKGAGSTGDIRWFTVGKASIG